MQQNRRGRQRGGGIRVDMTPMVDIMMLLLIFFIMSATFAVVNPAFSVNLPTAAAETQRSEQIDVLVNKAGQVAINGQVIAKTAIPAALSANGANTSTKVAIKADKSVEYGQVVEVMDTIRKTGITKIAIAVEAPGV